MIGRMHHLVVDCRDPATLADFYAELLGLQVTHRSPDWMVISSGHNVSGIAFQLAPDHQPPRWPDPDHPQQFHIDVMVDDMPTAAAQAVALGARPLDGDVYADPAGHPFCLIPRPQWAPPIHDTAG